MRGLERRSSILAVIVVLTVWCGPAAADQTNPPPTLDNNSASALQSVTIPAQSADSPESGRPGSVSVSAKEFEYRIVPACAPKRISDTAGGDATNCSYAMTACSYRTPPSDEILFWVQSRRTGDAKAAWTTIRTMCGLDDAPPGVPAPAVPTLGQIQTAFKQLPFSKPRVSIQPAGNVTLVNLPTYYRATWPDDNGLQPGEISKPVQLLSWSVEFKIAPRSYKFHYGDGSTSGAVTDAGGVYPDGAIKHTYSRAQHAAQVRVDSQLTGQYRVNGGEWVDINTVADLQDEPVTTLEVQEAKARLVND